MLFYADDPADDSDSGDDDAPTGAAPDTVQGLLPLLFTAAGAYLLVTARSKQRQQLGLLSIAASGTLMLIAKQKIEGAQTAPALDPANLDAFKAAISSAARSYASVILQVAKEQSVDPFLIAAIGQRESGWGSELTPAGPGGSGDFAFRVRKDGTVWDCRSAASVSHLGHGRGLMQLDDCTWGPDENGEGSGNGWLAENDWKDPYTNITKGVSIILANMSYFSDQGLEGDNQLHAAVAAYNSSAARVWKTIVAGQYPDQVTTGKDYSQWVVDHMNTYSSAFAESIGASPVLVSAWAPVDSSQV